MHYCPTHRARVQVNRHGSVIEAVAVRTRAFELGARSEARRLTTRNGLQEWLPVEALPELVAAFDTRIRTPLPLPLPRARRRDALNARMRPCRDLTDIQHPLYDLARIFCRAVWMMTPLRFWMEQETAESSRLMKAFRPPTRLTWASEARGRRDASHRGVATCRRP